MEYKIFLPKIKLLKEKKLIYKVSQKIPLLVNQIVDMVKTVARYPSGTGNLITLVLELRETVG